MKMPMAGTNAHILIVDDDATTRMMLQAAIEEMGHRVTVAPDGVEAMRVVHEDSVQVIISDWNMPEMNGLELCRAVRETPTNNYVYFILLTSENTDERIVEGLSSGADDFMSKPYNPAELRVRVDGALRVTALDTRDMTIFALAKLAESRDPETGKHLERVRAYSKAIAQQLLADGVFEEIDHGFIQLIFATSPLHDIGKVAIPDSILLKPDRLNDTEFDIMKTHTTAGADTLAAAAELCPEQAFLSMARDIAQSHHERFDGTGYPGGLRGEDIPLSARIVALADVYDALTSKRPYKEPFSEQVARQIINDGCGSHFDPRIVEAYHAIEAEFSQIRDMYKEDEDAFRSAA